MNIWVQDANFDSPCLECGEIIKKGAPITPKNEEAWRAGQPFDAVHINCRLNPRKKGRTVVGIKGVVTSTDAVLGPQHRFETAFEVQFGSGPLTYDQIMEAATHLVGVTVSNARRGV